MVLRGRSEFLVHRRHPDENKQVPADPRGVAFSLKGFRLDRQQVCVTYIVQLFPLDRWQTGVLVTRA